MHSFFSRTRPEPVAPPAPIPIPMPQPSKNTPLVHDQPVAASVRIQFPFAIPYCGAVILVVPRGKRLVIESVSFEGKSRSAQGFLRASTTFDGHPMNFIIPAVGLNPNGHSQLVAGSASLRLYADAETSVTLSFHAGAGASNSGVNSVRASISGHYITV